MKKSIVTVLLFLLASSAFCQLPPFDSSKLKIRSSQLERADRGTLSIINAGTTEFPSAGWKLYFNTGGLEITGADSLKAKVSRVNGDMFRLAPLENFKDIKPRDSVVLTIRLNRKNITDAPSGFYLVWESMPGKGFPVKNVVFETPAYTKEDELKLASRIYNQNRQISNLPASSLPLIFPSPLSIRQKAAKFVLKPGVSILADPLFSKEAKLLSEELSKVLGTKPFVSANSQSAAIILKKAALPGTEQYHLSVSEKRIVISASTPAGIWRGIQSVKSLMPPEALASVQKQVIIPGVEVDDQPRFPHRAVMLDVARNFRPVGEVLKVFDLMSLYKLNVLHFHLNDDEGWRLEIPSLPELTTIGAYRAHTSADKSTIFPSYGSGADTTDKNGNGFYSKSDFIRILKYATERHIRVIPEIETPGHARAAIKAMDARYERLRKEGKEEAAAEYLLRDLNDKSSYRSVQGWDDNVINVALPSAYRFLETVIDNMISMYRQAGAPLQTIHMGGDEVPLGVWTESAAVKTLYSSRPEIKNPDDLWYYYFGKMDQILKKRNLYLSGWEEIALRKVEADGKKRTIPNTDFVNSNFHTDVWNNMTGSDNADLAYRLANAGYKVLLTCVTHFYFDLASNPSYYEPGQYWGGYVDVDKPFYFIPFDYYKSTVEDDRGMPLDPKVFEGKERLTEAGKKNITGLQGPLWSETIKSNDRLEYMLLPKLLGLAERAWAADPSWATEPDSSQSRAQYQRAWSEFINVLGKKELPRLDHYAGGFNYRIPAPGIEIKNGEVSVNSQIPDFVIRYTTDGTEPNSRSAIYSAPLKRNGRMIFRSFNAAGRGGRSVEVD